MRSGWPCVLARVVMLEEGPPASCRGPARWEGCTLSIYTPGPGPRDYGCPRWGGQAPVALRLALPSRRPLSYPAGPCGHDQEEDSGLGAGRVHGLWLPAQGRHPCAAQWAGRGEGHIQVRVGGLWALGPMGISLVPGGSRELSCAGDLSQSAQGLWSGVALPSLPRPCLGSQGGVLR